MARSVLTGRKDTKRVGQVPCAPDPFSLISLSSFHKQQKRHNFCGERDHPRVSGEHLLSLARFSPFSKGRKGDLPTSSPLPLTSRAVRRPAGLHPAALRSGIQSRTTPNSGSSLSPQDGRSVVQVLHLDFVTFPLTHRGLRAMVFLVTRS